MRKKFRFRKQYLHKLALLWKAVAWPKAKYLYPSGTVYLRVIQMEAPTEWLQLEGKIPRLSSRSQQAMKNDSKKTKCKKTFAYWVASTIFHGQIWKRSFRWVCLRRRKGLQSQKDIRELSSLSQGHRGKSRENLLEELRVATALGVWIAYILGRGSLLKEFV